MYVTSILHQDVVVVFLYFITTRIYTNVAKWMLEVVIRVDGMVFRLSRIVRKTVKVGYGVRDNEEKSL